MNEVLKNTHVFVDVLRMARSDEVKQWDESAFEKAFKWAGYFEEASLHVLNYCAFIWIHAFWSVLAYDLLDNRCVDDGTIKKILLFYYIKKWRVCTVKDHRRRQNVVRASVILDQLYLLSFFLFFLPHFIVICHLLLNRCAASLNPFVNVIRFELSLSC